MRGEAPREQMFAKFCTSEDMPNLIICSSFDVKKLRGLGYMGGQILVSSIEMAGYPYYSAVLKRSP